LNNDRNFLDEFSYEIVDWLRDEEAKYQADLLADEVQKYVRQSSTSPDSARGAATAIEGGVKKRKGSPGKSNF
jgi:hypothetical protein